VSRRVDVDESAAPIVLPADVHHELLAHAREAAKLPEECCGLILGDAEQRFRRVVRCQNEMNKRHEADPVRYPRDARQGFWMSEADTQRAVEEADAAGLAVQAVYHSHVEGDAYLSETDLAYAEPGAFPDAAQVVIGVANGEASRVALFQRDGVGRPFRGHPVASEPT